MKSDSGENLYPKYLEQYSTLEQKVGIWASGDPIYRKVIDVGTLPNGTTKSVSTGLNITSVTPIFLSGYALKTTGEYACMPLPFTTDTNPVYVGYTSTNNIWNIKITTSSNRSSFNGYIVLEYIKTTN